MKRLLYHAEVMETVERADEFGIHTDVTDVDFTDIVREVNDDVSDSADSIHLGLQTSSQHTLFEGGGRFVNDRTPGRSPALTRTLSSRVSVIDSRISRLR